MKACPGRLLLLAPYGIGCLNFALVNVVYRLKRGTFFGGDTSEYLGIAAGLISSAPYEATKPLGYPLVLALSRVLPGPPVESALVVNAILYLVTIHVVGVVSRELGLPRGLTFGVQTGFALLPNPALWANILMTETMASALFLAAFALFLRACSPRSGARALIHAGGLGIVLGLLAITRSEYMVFLPLAALLAGVLPLCGGGSRRRAAALVVTTGVFSLPVLAVQPLANRGQGASLIPPQQSGFVKIWASQYDLEFTQYRLHRLWDVLREAPRRSEADVPELRERIYGLKYNYVQRAPIDDAVLERAWRDVEVHRDFVLRQGLTPGESYRRLALQAIVERPEVLAWRAVKRFLLFVTADNLDWPRWGVSYWIYTIALRPVSLGAWLWLVVLVVGNGPCRRSIVLAMAAWTSFPLIVHAALTFEQRFALPAIPFLSLLWGMGFHGYALAAWSRRGQDRFKPGAGEPRRPG